MPECDELLKKACWVVCPMCDYKKCVGRRNCIDIKNYVDKLKGEEK